MGGFTSGSEAVSMGDDSGTLIGKLRFFCPNLFIKLSAWERDFLGTLSWRM
jgi:hypothetical protein